jgi:hypothetical protein
MKEEFFKMVDSIPVDPLVSWARDEIVRLEALLADRAASTKSKKKEVPEDKTPT